eukprot:3644412-Amphidinium_carterae.1
MEQHWSSLLPGACSKLISEFTSLLYNKDIHMFRRKCQRSLSLLKLGSESLWKEDPHSRLRLQLPMKLGLDIRNGKPPQTRGTRVDRLGTRTLERVHLETTMVPILASPIHIEATIRDLPSSLPGHHLRSSYSKGTDEKPSGKGKDEKPCGKGKGRSARRGRPTLPREPYEPHNGKELLRSSLPLP